MKVPPCPRCKGRIFLEDDEWVCMMCGARPTGFGISGDSAGRLMHLPRDSYTNHGNAHYVHFGFGSGRTKIA